MFFAAGLVFFFSLSFGVWADEQQEAEEALKALRVTIEALKKELEAVKGEKGSLEQQLQESETEISDTEKKIQTIEKQLKDQQAELGELHRERSRLLLAQQQQQQHIGEHLKTLYINGGQSELKLVLNGENPQTLARFLAYYEYLVSARSEKIDQFTETIAELNRIEPAIRKKKQQLNASEQQLVSRQQALLHNQQQRRQTLKEMNALISNKDGELQSQEANRARLEKLIAKLSAAVAGLQIPAETQISTLAGQLPWPLKGPLVHQFGSSRGGQLPWDGIVIKASVGTEVKAVHHGRVVFADYLRGLGLLVIIDHGEQMMTLYGHNQTLNKTLGDWVNPGEVIATAGNTGGKSQAGLYFAVRREGVAVDPRHWLTRV